MKVSNERGTILAFLLVIIAIIGGSILLLVTRPAPAQITIIPPLPTATPEPTSTPAPVTVYVTGAVLQPNTTHVLPPGSRVQDAVNAAGGTAENADLSGVNMAALLRDGDQIHVPSAGQTSAETLPTASGGTIMNINTATQAELETLPGVGPALAQRIIEYRTSNGRIDSFEELDGIEGVGPALLENLQGLVSFAP
jgi:competence protein ComEA